MPEELDNCIRAVDEAFEILSVSKPYPNKNSAFVRVYLEVKIRKSGRNRKSFIDFDIL